MADKDKPKHRIVKLDPNSEHYYTRLAGLVSLMIDNLLEYPTEITSNLGWLDEPSLDIVVTIKLRNSQRRFKYNLSLFGINPDDIQETARSEVAFIGVSLDKWLEVQGIKL